MRHGSCRAAAVVLSCAYSVSAQQSAWGQCGGSGYTGSTACISGYTCIVLNPYYSQCQPGTAVTTPLTTPPITTKSATTTVSKTTSTASSTGTGTGTGTGATGPGTTLQSPYTWIRAVEDPHYHQYLQSTPLYSAGPAVLDNYTSAGQFAITTDGQLTQLISSSSTVSAQVLYAVVAGAASHDGRTLAVTFSASKNTFGTFAWSGDALGWTAGNVTRPQVTAWYVCEGNQVFVNLGPYLYETPAGCADETIHSYGAAQASS